MDFGPSETLAVPDPPRRRQGGNKRRSLSNLNSSFPSAKRLAKERNNPNALLPPIHSGPVTRARQSPMKIAAAAAAAAAAAEGPDQAGRKENDGRLCPDTREEVMVVEEPIVDKDFEEVRSREKNIHVVPSHAGECLLMHYVCLFIRIFIVSFWGFCNWGRSSIIYLFIVVCDE